MLNHDSLQLLGRHTGARLQAEVALCRQRGRSGMPNGEGSADMVMSICHIITNTLNLVKSTQKRTAMGVSACLQGALLPPARRKAGVGPLAGPHLVAALDLIPEQLRLPQPSAWPQHSLWPLRHRPVTRLAGIDLLPQLTLGRLFADMVQPP